MSDIRSILKTLAKVHNTSHAMLFKCLFKIKLFQQSSIFVCTLDPILFVSIPISWRSRTMVLRSTLEVSEPTWHITRISQRRSQLFWRQLWVRWPLERKWPRVYRIWSWSKISWTCKLDINVNALQDFANTYVQLIPLPLNSHVSLNVHLI